MKKTVLTSLLGLVFLAVFNVIFFVLTGPERLAAMWISYAFIHFAYIMFCVTPFLVRRSSAATIFGLSIGLVSMVYFIVELIVGIAFIFIDFQSIKTPLIVHVIITGIYLTLLLIVLISNEKTADDLAVAAEETQFFRTAAARVKVLIDRVSDPEAKKAVEKAYDQLKSSPIKSSPIVKSVESEMESMVLRLESVAGSDNKENIIQTASAICDLSAQRKELLKSIQ